MKIISYSKKNVDYGIDVNETRFAIADDDGKIIDDAQGYGYKTSQKAHKAMWYKFQNGKQKIKDKTNNKKAFFKKYPGLEKFLNNIIENNFKEMARGEITDIDILNDIKKEFGVDMPKEYLYY